MFEPKPISYVQPGDPIAKSVAPGACLALGVRDKNGVEYYDGHIVIVGGVDPTRIGYIRYFGGRFEVVCPYKSQRFIYGLNYSHEIIGHMFKDEDFKAIERQMQDEP